jgi:hypothetical protein
MMARMSRHGAWGMPSQFFMLLHGRATVRP